MVPDRASRRHARLATEARECGEARLGGCSPVPARMTTHAPFASIRRGRRPGPGAAGRPAATGGDHAVSRKALVLFAVMCVVWGIPYLLIKVAVSEITPASLVFLR